MRLSERVGERNKNKYGSEMVIVKYNNATSIIVEFENGNRKHTAYSEFINGTVKSVYDKSVCGVGYIGEGIYKTSIDGKHTREYSCWKSMIERCYSQKRERYQNYNDCIVDDEWHNFQNFAEWYNENFYTINNEPTDLDKDILLKGNKIYSKHNCIFAPSRINTLFIKCDSKRGDLPVGVSFNKSNNKYQVRCRNEDKKRINLGYFTTKEDAFLTYKNYKENLIKRIASEYKEKIPPKLYDAMIKYEIHIND